MTKKHPAPPPQLTYNGYRTSPKASPSHWSLPSGDPILPVFFIIGERVLNDS